MQEDRIDNQNKLEEQNILNDLYRIYLNDLQRFVRSRVSDISAREDIISEVFLDIITYVRSGKDVRSARALLYRIARNTVIDYYKEKAKFIKHEYPDGQVLDAQQSEEDHPEISADRAFALREIGQQLVLLKPEYQEVVRLRFIEELTLKEISTVLNKSLVGVRVLLHRAVRALRKKLEEARHL